MKDNPIVNFFKYLIGYFAMLFILTWIAEKIFCDFAYIKVFLLNGKILKGLLLAFLAYVIYFFCAIPFVESGKTGKLVMIAIVAFSAYGMYQDIIEATASKTGLDYAGTLILYLIYSLEDILRVIATIHVMKWS